MKKILSAIRRLWLIGTCKHWNATRGFTFSECDGFVFCKRCGLVVGYRDDDSGWKDTRVTTGRRGKMPGREAA